MKDPYGDSPLQVKTLAEAVLQSAQRLGLLWHLRPATIVKAAADGSPRAVYDGDAEPMRVVSLVGPLPLNARVMVMITPPAGNHVIGFLGPPPWPLGVIAQVERAGASTPSTAAQPVLRMDNVPVTAGRRYRIYTSTFLIFSTAVNDNGSARISFTTDGTSAGTASTLLTLFNSSDIATTGDGTGAMLSQDYVPAVDLKLSLLLFTTRVQGTGSISLVSTASQRIQLTVEDRGLAVPSAGQGFVL
jgi:hypothetical protein